MLSRLLIASTFILLGGCSILEDEPYVPPKETLAEYDGRVLEKNIITDPNKERKLASARAQSNRKFAGIIGDAFTLFGVNLLDVNVEGETIKYIVKMENDKNITIYNKFPGFEVGQCVTVLIVQETKEARMTSGSRCGN